MWVHVGGWVAKHASVGGREGRWEGGPDGAGRLERPLQQTCLLQRLARTPRLPPCCVQPQLDIGGRLDNLLVSNGIVFAR